MSKNFAVNAIHTKSGGGLVYLLNVLPYLAKKTPKPLDVYVDAVVASKFKGIENTRIIPINVPQNFALMHLWEQTVFALKLRFKGYSALLCNANYVPLLAKNPVPILHTNSDVRFYEERFAMKVYWKTLIFLTRLTAKRVRAGLSVARHILPAYGAEKYTVAPPAVGFEAQNNVERDASTLVAVGDIYIQKDYMVLLKAFKKFHKYFPTCRLMIVGREIDKEIAKQLKKFVEENNLRQSVTFSGHVSHSQLMPLLERTSLYVSTSLVECFNMPVLEALACGAPVVVFDRAFQREVAGHAAHYVTFDEVETKRVENMAEGMKAVMASGHLKEELSQNGRDRAKHFSWATTAENIFNTLIKK